MTEFKKGDVLAEIWHTKIYWIVKAIDRHGYYIDAWFDGSYHKSGTWISFRSASRDLVKVDEWDEKRKRMKGIDLD